MKLFLVHCGFYDLEICDGIYESHINIHVIAASPEEARLKAKQDPSFVKKRMHVDGIQEIAAINGYRIDLKEDPSLKGESIIVSNRHRDLAPKPATTPSN